MSAWAATDPTGKRAVVPSQRLAGVIVGYRLTSSGRVFAIETPTGNPIEIAEGDCHPEGHQAPAQFAVPKPANQMGHTVMSMSELAELIVRDGTFAATVAPRAVRILAEDYLALRRSLEGGTP